MKRLSFGGIAGTLIWLASLVKVTGYTWAAYTQTYQQFPSGGSGQGLSGLANAAGKAFASPLPVQGATTGLAVAGQNIGAILAGLPNGSQYGTPVHLSNTTLNTWNAHPPPPNIDNPLDGKNMTAARTFVGWALRHGWKPPAIREYLAVVKHY